MFGFTIKRSRKRDSKGRYLGENGQTLDKVKQSIGETKTLEQENKQMDLVSNMIDKSFNIMERLNSRAKEYLPDDIETDDNVDPIDQLILEIIQDVVKNNPDLVKRFISPQNQPVEPPAAVADPRGSPTPAANPTDKLNQALATLAKIPDQAFNKKAVAAFCKQSGIDENNLKEVSFKIAAAYS